MPDPLTNRYYGPEKEVTAKAGPEGESLHYPRIHPVYTVHERREHLSWTEAGWAAKTLLEPGLWDKSERQVPRFKENKAMHLE